MSSKYSAINPYEPSVLNYICYGNLNLIYKIHCRWKPKWIETQRRFLVWLYRFIIISIKIFIRNSLLYTTINLFWRLTNNIDIIWFKIRLTGFKLIDWIINSAYINYLIIFCSTEKSPLISGNISNRMTSAQVNIILKTYIPSILF